MRNQEKRRFVSSLVADRRSWRQKMFSFLQLEQGPSWKFWFSGTVIILKQRKVDIYKSGVFLLALFVHHFSHSVQTNYTTSIRLGKINHGFGDFNTLEQNLTTSSSMNHVTSGCIGQLNAVFHKKVCKVSTRGTTSSERWKYRIQYRSQNS